MHTKETAFIITDTGSVRLITITYLKPFSVTMYCTSPSTSGSDHLIYNNTSGKHVYTQSISTSSAQIKRQEQFTSVEYFALQYKWKCQKSIYMAAEQYVSQVRSVDCKWQLARSTEHGPRCWSHLGWMRQIAQWMLKFLYPRPLLWTIHQSFTMPISSRKP